MANLQMRKDAATGGNRATRFSEVRGLPSPKKAPSRMPELRLDVVKTVTMLLSHDGRLVESEKDVVRLREEEVNPTNRPRSPLKLIQVGKCKPSDPMPLMPSCSSYDGANFPPEPIRDRDKDWYLDSQRDILGDEIDVSVGWRMKDLVRRRSKEKDSEGNDSPTFLPLGTYPVEDRNERKPIWIPDARCETHGQRIWRGGVTMSESYCVATVVGAGMAGRAYAEGLHKPRCLMVDVYEVDACASHRVWVGMERLRSLFGERPEFLKAGVKHDMVRELCKMCKLKCPDDGIESSDGDGPCHQSNETAETPINSVGERDQECAGDTVSTGALLQDSVPLEKSMDHIDGTMNRTKRLEISAGRKLSDAEKRRRRRATEERTGDANNGKESESGQPVRQKFNRLFTCCARISGFLTVCNVFRLGGDEATQNRNLGTLLIRIFERQSCNVYEIKIESSALESKFNLRGNKRAAKRDLNLTDMLSIFLLGRPTAQTSGAIFDNVSHKAGKLKIVSEVEEFSETQKSRLVWVNGGRVGDYMDLLSLPPLPLSRFVSDLPPCMEKDASNKSNCANFLDNTATIQGDVGHVLFPIEMEREEAQTQRAQNLNGNGVTKNADAHETELPNDCSSCERQGSQPTDKTFCTSFSNDLSRTLTIKCESTPRRRIGRGKLLTSGVSRIEDEVIVFHLHRCGKGDCWWSCDGDEDLFDLYIYDPNPRCNASFMNFSEMEYRIQMWFDDLYRVCKGTDLMESLQLCHPMKEAAMGALVEDDAQEAVSAESSGTSQEVTASNKTWLSIVRKLLAHCSWFDHPRTGELTVQVNGHLQQKEKVLPILFAEPISSDRQKLHRTIQLNCKIYEDLHQVLSSSKVNREPRFFNIVVSQEHQRLRYIACDDETGEYFEFSQSDEEQAALVESLRNVSEEEARIQISESMIEVVYEDDGFDAESQKPKFKLSFGGGGFGSAINVHISDEQIRRATMNMDKMMAENVRKAKSREKSATTRLI